MSRYDGFLSKLPKNPTHFLLSAFIIPGIIILGIGIALGAWLF